ncbi:glycosyltransferase involved in cell wall biosynthesis [Chryseobacterium sp. H1D6B]|uniref:glycosyltransferase family 2 protein n=1 Tax=Chryseobacterium sp. H1D6B TaxID=2940588 RepID=UPI0015CC2EDE|nr:glycosyltransferase family 2 protein [Chryseobacterium sp. H1D6B]MDH6251912.1 glycosyltransferase involved in cell wall biosynthesis [Chryseobacterium sp. H1D6B]
MDFSILIANYNNGKYFKDCYESIISQEYKDWEVIIVDDCSIDNSVELIRNIIGGDPRFKIYSNPENKGCGYTKRKCLEYASGQYCAFLDPDDALFPNALQDSITFLKKHDKYIATYSTLTLYDENLELIGDFKKIKQIYNEKFFFNTPTQLNAFFSFKREAYLKTEGIDPTLKSAVDQDLYLKLLEHGNAKYLRRRMYKYRQHTQGISQCSSKEKAKASFAKVIFNALKRRNITQIHGKNVPNSYVSPNEIFTLLEYQTHPLYRLKAKILSFFL